MTRPERLKYLLSQYSANKLTIDERKELFHLIQTEDIDGQVNGWMYMQWASSSSRSPDFYSEGALRKIRSNLNMEEKPSCEEKDYMRFVINETRSKQPWYVKTMQFAAIFAVFFFAAVLLYQYGDRFFAPESDVMTEIRVSNGSKSNIILPDGSSVWINSGSKLTYPEQFSVHKREVFLEGEAFFEVQGNARQPFFVNTSQLEIRATGTQFNVKSFPDEEQIETTLISGRVVIKRRVAEGVSKREITLLPNHLVVFNKSTSKYQIRDLSLKQEENQHTPIVVNLNPLPRKESEILTAWKEDKFVFHNEPFEQLAARMERWYNVQIIMDQKLVGLRFSGTFEGETAEQAMKALRLAADIDYQFENKTITIRKSKP